MNLLTAAFNAPLVGVLRRWPHRLHAVTMEAVVDGWKRGSFKSACGLRGMAFCAATFEESPGSDPTAAPWPPRLQGMPEGFIRCRVCWEATGKKRPRCQYKPKAAA